MVCSRKQPGFGYCIFDLCNISPEPFITILDNIVCPLIVPEAAPDKTVNRIRKFCNRLVIFLYCHKVGYQAKTDEIIKSYSMNKINADTSNLSVSAYE